MLAVFRAGAALVPDCAAGGLCPSIMEPLVVAGVAGAGTAATGAGAAAASFMCGTRRK